MVSRPTRLRVGVPSSHVQMASSSGWGRMWRSVVPLIEPHVNLGLWGDPRRSRFRQPPDVWLYDGHLGHLGVPEPAVVHLMEATWRDPSTRPMMTPEFIAQYEEPSRLAAEGAARVITPSESSRRQIISQYAVDPDHVLTVPLGVDLALFRPGRPGAREVISRAGGDPDRPYVLYVSTLSPRKNLGALRAAMTGLARRGLPYSLVIAASPPPDREDWSGLLAEASADLPGAPGRIVVLSALSDVDLAAVMAGATVFCLPSLMEGFGLTSLEAMACGTPVVVSDRGSLPEVVGEAGVVTAADAAALEVALYDVLTSPERQARLSQAGLARALQFSWQATAQGWLDALHQAVPEPRVGAAGRLAPASDFIAQALTRGIRIPVRRRRSMVTGHSATSSPSARRLRDRPA